MFDKLVTTKEVLAHDMVSYLQGKIPDEKLEAAVETMRKLSKRHAANGNLWSMVFYLQIQVAIDGGKQFQGRAFGISFPGGGANFGDVYTDDIERLYKATTTFQFNSTPIYFNVNFFDDDWNLLGHYHAAAISTVTGIGGGDGSWR
ncbi:VapA/VapB family virulence-associated protein [Caenispirillum bisanense]|uniref:VapA/VapB family virulence-associated protein n=1 Tax=Caenispirillum bisanense TaxID=414052 RepID=UPI0031E2A6FA